MISISNNGFVVFAGRQAGNERTMNIGEKVVMNLCQFYKSTNRNITTDNFFTSLPLVHYLQSIGLTLLGTLRKNKPYIPKEMQPAKQREIYSTVFGFRGNITICSYVPKQNKAVILLSSEHHDSGVDITTVARKPKMILDYNRTKGGVDRMDQMLSTYSTKRKTNRWPLAFFYNMIDVAALASYIIYMEHHQSLKTKSGSRKVFLKDLAFDLCVPSIRKRSRDPLTTRFYFVRTAMESVLGVKLTSVIVPAPRDAVQKDASGHTKVQGNCKPWQMVERGRLANDALDQHTAPAPAVCLECSLGAPQ